MKDTLLFAGRVEEIQFLFQAFGRVEAGKPQVVMIEGAAGLGKTALLQVFCERAAQRANSSYIFHIRPPRERAYEPVSQAAAEATNKLLYDKMGGRRNALQAARQLLPDWLGAIPGIGEIVSAIVATVQALRRRRKKATPAPVLKGDDATDALLAAAARRPLVLLLDDLHLAEPPAIEQLERLIHGRTAEHRLLIVGAYRPAAPGRPAAAVHRMIQALPRDTVLKRRLQELEPHELEALVTKRLPYVVIPPSFLHWLVENTGGQPQAVAAALDDLVHRSVIRFVDRRWHIDAEAEDIARDGSVAVTAALKVDLSGVRPPVMAVLRAASLLGEEFDGSTVAALLERDELYVEDQLAHAAHQGLVEVRGEITLPSGDIATLFRFSSGSLRAALARETSPEERAELSRRRAALAASS
jgi:predicted ATPase